MSMTKQDIFDTVVAHLRAQKVQALRADGGGCAYRGEGGTKCAVGCLIKDEEYKPDFDKGAGLNATCLFEQCEPFRTRILGKMETKEIFRDERVELLHALQTAHDFHFDRLEERLPMLAERFNLTLKLKES